eukprot:CAMPEP_0206544940 /NCGR_PEP_ID=MMETSP0325_2-20121206/11840_1 /ASSEMBLY_ACC=CAM_ASM_000347 /TAXON_ID=2866 /ORGANISM="Crypthecodinium cohnii, Strain Seligo" /LENGTH=1078 /DNA_ID=CAMNT_0054043831 /DNA_START=83 /DNA_END=3319 /DNA_ORIENTATION=-
MEVVDVVPAGETAEIVGSVEEKNQDVVVDEEVGEADNKEDEDAPAAEAPANADADAEVQEQFEEQSKADAPDAAQREQKQEQEQEQEQEQKQEQKPEMDPDYYLKTPPSKAEIEAVIAAEMQRVVESTMSGKQSKPLSSSKSMEMKRSQVYKSSPRTVLMGRPTPRKLDVSPGPGAYTVSQESGDVGYRNPRVFFGSASPTGRLAGHGQGFGEAAPGPGAYRHVEYFADPAWFDKLKQKEKAMNKLSSSDAEEEQASTIAAGSPLSSLAASPRGSNRWASPQQSYDRTADQPDSCPAPTATKPSQRLSSPGVMFRFGTSPARPAKKGPKYGSDVGPGAYNTPEAHTYSSKSSPNFSMQSRTSYDMTCHSDTELGPGQYQTQPEKILQSPPQTRFGTSPSRPQFPPARGYERAGPGAYSPLDAKSQSSPNYSMGARRESVTMTSTDPNLGPGTYVAVDAPTSSTKNLPKTVFGKSPSRPIKKPGFDKAGPGAYDPKASAALPSSPNFSMAARRENSMPTSTAPELGPGAYAKADPLTTVCPTSARAVFGKSPSRPAKPPCQGYEKAGPGAYSPISAAALPTSPNFSMGARRDNPLEMSTTAELGPGVYAHADPLESICPASARTVFGKSPSRPAKPPAFGYEKAGPGAYTPQAAAALPTAPNFSMGARRDNPLEMSTTAELGPGVYAHADPLESVCPASARTVFGKSPSRPAKPPAFGYEKAGPGAYSPQPAAALPTSPNFSMGARRDNPLETSTAAELGPGVYAHADPLESVCPTSARTVFGKSPSRPAKPPASGYEKAGPGAYDPRSGATVSTAPNFSMGARRQNSLTPSTTPELGPGAYANADPLTTVCPKSARSVFGKSPSRPAHPPARGYEKAGPGTYDPKAANALASAPNFSMGARRENSLPPSTKPELGPGFYPNSASLTTSPSSARTVFGKSPARPSTQAASRGFEKAGPGAYENQAISTLQNSPSYSAGIRRESVTTTFVSSSNPGPGSYNSKDTAAKSAPKCAFPKQAARPDARKQRCRSPEAVGPGKYEVPSALSSKGFALRGKCNQANPTSSHPGPGFYPLPPAFGV